MIATTLQRRTTTGILLFSGAVVAILLLPTPVLALCLAGIVLLGAWEWTTLAGLTRTEGRIGYLITAATLLAALWSTPSNGEQRVWLLAVVALWWCWIALRLTKAPLTAPSPTIDWPLLGIGLLVLPGPWLALVALHGINGAGAPLTLFLIFLISIADSTAYFTGRRWGRTKLAPRLSPGKTWAGVYGALAGALSCGLLLAWGLDLDGYRAIMAILLCAAGVLMSIVGDLYESLLKRRRGLKDSGRLLPGHGGMLDRIDSYTAAAPFFALGLILLGID